MEELRGANAVVNGRFSCPAPDVVVVNADPVADGGYRLLDVVEALTMDALLLRRSDDALDHSVLLWATRRDELRFEAEAANQGGVVPRPAVRPWSACNRPSCAASRTRRRAWSAAPRCHPPNALIERPDHCPSSRSMSAANFSGTLL